MDRDHSGFFQGQQGPRRQWQYRGEVQAARDARRLRLLQLIGYESLLYRTMGCYRGRDATLGLGVPGLSQQELAERLTEEGHHGRGGGPVSQSTISRDLQWLLKWADPHRGYGGEEVEFYRAHPELARPLSPLERAAGYPVRAPNERPGRTFVEHRQAKMLREIYQEIWGKDRRG